MVGLASEIFLGAYWLLQPRDFSNTIWKFSNVVFAFFVFIGLWCRSIMGLPLFVAGMFKLGFPETICYLERAQREWNRGAYVNALVNFLNGFGELLHHTCAILGGVQFMTQRWKISRIVAPGMSIITLQHLFVVVRYTWALLGTVLTLLLEIGFEWEFFSNYQYFDPNVYDKTIRAVITGLLISHWMYLLAAIIDIMNSQQFLPRNPMRQYVERSSKGFSFAKFVK
jgi:hypothetical protein